MFYLMAGTDPDDMIWLKQFITYLRFNSFCGSATLAGLTVVQWLYTDEPASLFCPRGSEMQIIIKT